MRIGIIEVGAEASKEDVGKLRLVKIFSDWLQRVAVMQDYCHWQREMEMARHWKRWSIHSSAWSHMVICRALGVLVVLGPGVQVFTGG
jgi:hypothetical protein